MKILFDTGIENEDKYIYGVEFMITDLGVYITIGNKYVKLEKEHLEKVLKLL